MKNPLSRIFRGSAKPAASVVEKAEGSVLPGPYFLQDGWLSARAGRFLNWWQMGYSVQPYSGSNAMVEACVAAYAQTIAMCPGDHWRLLDTGGRDRVKLSALSRILKSPNDYQSSSDFLLNLVRRLMTNGEVFAVAVRNDRSEIAELHLMREGMVQLAVDGSIFYRVSGNEVVERRFDLTYPIPARDVLHVRLHTPQSPLKGVSPILSAALDLALSGAAISQQVAFYLNQARPSFVLQTEQKLTLEQTIALREAWNAQTTGDNAGGTPILSWGLEAKPIGSSARDAQLAELLKMTEQNIALAFRMPLQILGLGGTPFASTELLMQSWIASGLGFVLNHIEEALGQLFRLKGFPEEYVEFDTKALLRSAYKERIEALARGVISGIYSPDEARAEENLPKVPGGVGSEPRVQQQVVPLSYGAAMKPPEAPSEDDPPADPADEDETEPDEEVDEDEPDAGDEELQFSTYFDAIEDKIRAEAVP